MANPSWFNEVEYLNGKLVQLNANGFKDANGNAFTSISQVADAITAGEMSAFEHYNMYGSKEGISPSNAFNAVEYCMFKLNSLRSTGPDAQKAEWAGKTWQDVQYEIHKSGMSLGEHYAEYGFVEGVPMSNAFDGNKYLEAKLALLQADEATSAQWTGKNVTDLADYFRTAGTDPYTHYLTFGGVEGEVPSGMSFKPEPVNPGGGVTEVLTTGVDTVAATAKDTTIIASVVSGSGTFTAGDSLTGGAGNDTLVLDNQGNVTAGLQTVSGIENVVVYGGSSSAYNADMSQFAGMKSFSYTGVDKVTANFVDTVTDVTLNGAATASAVTGTGIANVSLKSMAGAADATVTVNNSTADHALKLTLEKVGNDTTDKELTLADATLGKLDIVSNGEMNSLAFHNDTAKLTAVTVTGKGDLDLGMNGSAAGSGGANVKSIDGSAAEGDLFISNVAAGTNSIKTGIGDDTITTAIGNMTAADKYEMGEGENTLALLNSNATGALVAGGLNFTDKNAAYMKGILASTGVDVLDVTVTTTRSSAAAGTAGDMVNGAAYMSVNMGLFKDTNVDTFTVQSAGVTTGSGFWGQAGSDAHASSGTKLASDGGNGMTFVSNNSTLEIINSDSAAAKIFEFHGASGGAGNSTVSGGGDGGHGLQITHFDSTNSVNLAFEGNIAFFGGVGGVSGATTPQSLGGHGLEASQIDSINMVFSEVTTNVAFTGASGGDSGPKAADIVIGSKGVITLVGEADKIDLGFVQSASGNPAGGAANTTIDATGFDGRVKVTTGLGNDTLIGGNKGDLLIGGAGEDTFFGGTGKDYFVVGVTGNTTAATKATATIKDFTTGEDKIAIQTTAINDALDAVTLKETNYDTVAEFVAAADTALSAAGIFIATVEDVVYVAGSQDGGTTITDIIRLENIELTGIKASDFALVNDANASFA